MVILIENVSEERPVKRRRSLSPQPAFSIGAPTLMNTTLPTSSTSKDATEKLLAAQREQERLRKAQVADILARAGEPYVSSRYEHRRARDEASFEGGGLGLGLFIAKTLLERSGASLQLENATAPARGARVLVSWPRTAFESGTNPAKAAA